MDQLHWPWLVGFHDGSLSAYAMMVYVVWTIEVDDLTRGDKQVSRVMTLLLSKSRVSPVHGTTVPRAELQSLTVLSRIMPVVARALPERPERAIPIGDIEYSIAALEKTGGVCLLYTSPSPRD